ncbi:FxsB family cyclophane-forming radical SAM/SPASM peptide maturase [[Actinomadura] parvosata]|uniref:FxsB family cyclophane-forming radical SAM/SPASM peptide maturase n=1 Tax=[Actinomadura] parvosata TaxID=1955412 RepID=UPI00406D0708
MPEWPETLDVGGLLAEGWRPRPFRQFLLKVHSRCNLACDYCYVYTLSDQSWRSQPMLMSSAVVGATARRIAEHAQDHGLHSARLILHGGEPLLAGPEYLTDLVRRVRDEAGPGVRIDAVVQTNAVLLGKKALDEFNEVDLKVGVSLDGSQRAHDRNRRYKDGRGTHAAVTEALRLLGRPEFRHLYSGILCTVDLANDPLETYSSLIMFEPPMIDFLLPHGTWESPPPGRPPDQDKTPYADWLIDIFDRWYGADRDETNVRMFHEIMRLLIGRSSASEAVGLTPSSLVVVETDGTMEQTDSLKAVGHGVAATGLNVTDHPFDAALRHPGIVARQLGWAALGQECRACRFGRICGAGLYPHRYRSGTGFRNPSVYCADLYRLIDHIRSRVVANLRRPAH